MKKLIIMAALLVPLAAQAEIYKCVEGGTTVFSDKPCGASAKPIDVEAPQPSVEDQLAAQVRHSAAQSELQLIEARKRSEEVSALKLQLAREQRFGREQTRKEECAEILRRRDDALEWSRRFQHPHNINNELYKVKQLEARHFSRCYGEW